MAEYPDIEIAGRLMQEKARRLNTASAPGIDAGEMTVYWDVSDKSGPECVDFLDRFAVGDNYTDEESTETRLITNPKADRLGHGDVWRVVRNWYDHNEAPGKVFQTRRKGWMDASPVSQDGSNAYDMIDFSEARLIRGKRHHAIGGGVDEVMMVQWTGVDPKKARLITIAILNARTPFHLDEDENIVVDGFAPVIEGLNKGAGWRILPPDYATTDDGSATISCALVLLGSRLNTYSIAGKGLVSRTYTEQVTEDDADARITALQGMANIASVQPQHDSETGLVVIHYTKITGTAGALYYEVVTQDGATEYHKVAWEQNLATAAEINAAIKYRPGTLTEATVKRRVSGVQQHPVTKLYSYHVVCWNGGEEFGGTVGAPTVLYSTQWQYRGMWDTIAHARTYQQRIIVWMKEYVRHDTKDAAIAWTGADSPATPSGSVDGIPVWSGEAPSLPPEEGSSFVSAAGNGKFLAFRRSLAWSSAWHEATSW